MNDKSRLYFYVLLVFGSGLSLLLFTLREGGKPSALGLVVFGLLVVFAENFAVPLPRRGTVSTTPGIVLGCLFAYGAPSACLISALQFLNFADFKAKKPWYKHVFNLGQFLISTAVAGNIYDRLRPLALSQGTLGLALAVGASSLSYFLLNTFLTAGAISISESLPLINIWVYNFSWLLPFHFLITLIAVGISMLYLRFGWASLLFTIVPLILVQYIYLLTMRERKATLESIINLVRVMEAKDEYTAGHSKRVADYAERIARELGLNEYEIDALKNAAYLHDLGKVQVDLSVLHKGGELSPSDWEAIRRHSTVSADVAHDIPITRPISDVIRYHHERYDGQGYPDRLKGEQIPLLSRILSVADAFDAMTTKRPYREPFEENKAVDEIVRNSGKMFCPQVVQAFLKAYEKGDFLNHREDVAETQRR